MPTSSWIDLERVRNTLKGQPNDGSRGAPVAWKKDSDPAVAEDASTFWVLLDMLKWGVVSSLWRYLVHHLYPTTRCFWDVAQHPGVRGMVALTIDDCFCRQSPPEQHSMIGEVQALLKKHNAKATFFTTLCYSQGKWRRDAIKALLADGHQLANHGEEDREYDRDTAQEFERALDSTDEFIFQMANHEAAGSGSGSGSGRSDDAGSVGAVNGDGGSGSHRRRSNTGSVNSSEATSSGGGGEAPPSASNTSRRFRGSKWFRAPSASLSQTMSNVLKAKGMEHVLVDSYADDPHVPVPWFLSWAMCRAATHGSIIVLHMPERGFREWDLDTLERVLVGLEKKGLTSVTLSELEASA